MDARKNQIYDLFEKDLNNKKQSERNDSKLQR